MGLVSPELSLDFRPTFVPKTISDFLKDVSVIGNAAEKVLKLDDFVMRLQEEMRKIGAFKRELPLSMLLLNDAIVMLKEEKLQCMVRKVEPVLEEFIPLKKTCDEKIEEIKKEKDCKDKKNWMRSVQLWNNDGDHHSHTLDSKHNSTVQTKRNEKENCSEKISRAGGKAFLPFKTWSAFPFTVARKEDKEEILVQGLPFLTPGSKTSREESGSSGGAKSSCSRAVSPSVTNVQSNLRSGSQHLLQQRMQQSGRKQRRCWSPELHRRFINALQQLGGSQAATPKQIRELMRDDTLTNDEVKSHLQKYRLHTRRTTATTTASPADQSPAAVSGNLWMSQDDSSKAGSSQSDSPQGPFQLAGTGGGTSTTGGDSMDADDDEKSESYSCKSQANKPVKDNV